MNGVELAVVAAGEADLETIAALVNRAFLTHALMRGDRTDAGGLLEESGEGGRFILAKAGETIVGSAMVRPVNATDVHDWYAPPATALVLGNEEHGVTRACLARCPQQVYVPMLGQGASLNVHVAAAVVAFRARYPGSEPSKPAT